MSAVPLVVVCLLQAVLPQYAVSAQVAATMTKRTVLNSDYKGLVESMSIPAELHERGGDGKLFASFGSVVPIHCCTPEQVTEHSQKTHHYCDIFTEQLLAPPGELAYVRLDENFAEKVFINRTKRVLMTSSDGVLAQWRSASTFESGNRFVAGAPIVNSRGELVSVVTARHGNHYAVSSFEGEGGYFETSESWRVQPAPATGALYGDRAFDDRDGLRAYIRQLPAEWGAPLTPVLWTGAARLALVASSGRQLAHHYLSHTATTDVEYLHYSANVTFI